MTDFCTRKLEKKKHSRNASGATPPSRLFQTGGFTGENESSLSFFFFFFFSGSYVKYSKIVRHYSGERAPRSPWNFLNVVTGGAPLERRREGASTRGTDKRAGRKSLQNARRAEYTELYQTARRLILDSPLSERTGGGG